MSAAVKSVEEHGGKARERVTWKKVRACSFRTNRNAGLALPHELFEELPAEGSFSRSGSRVDDVEPRTEKLKLVEIIEAGAAF